MYTKVLIRYGELTLKGKNKKDFITKVYNMVRDKTLDLNVEYIKKHDRLYIDLLDTDYTEVVGRLNKVFGLHSYSLVTETTKDIEDIKTRALELAQTIEGNKTFKVETKRSDKRYFMTSPEITQVVAKHVLINTENLKVDVRKPEVTLTVEVRDQHTFMYFGAEKGLGGLPLGSSGRGMLLLSGGIDSPVAAFQTMRRGMVIEGIHFESTPLTPIESAQKVIDLTKKIAEYAPLRGIKVHMVPFKDLHMAILNNVSDAYKITIMRRMMFRISEKLALKLGGQCLITGDNLGQVASQTIESMSVINDVVNIPVLRPLISMDKNDIIDIAKKIDTYDISIQPFEDCCTVYVPQKPVTKPRLNKCLFEEKFDFEAMVDWCVENTQTARVKVDCDIDLPAQGFEVQL